MEVAHCSERCMTCHAPWMRAFFRQCLFSVNTVVTASVPRGRSRHVRIFPSFIASPRRSASIRAYQWVPQATGPEVRAARRTAHRPVHLLASGVAKAGECPSPLFPQCFHVVVSVPLLIPLPHVLLRIRSNPLCRGYTPLSIGRDRRHPDAAAHVRAVRIRTHSTALYVGTTVQ